MTDKKFYLLKLTAWLVIALVLYRWWQNDNKQLGVNLIIISMLALLAAPMRARLLGIFMYMFAFAIYYFRMPMLGSLPPLLALGFAVIFLGLIFSSITVAILFYGTGDRGKEPDNKLNQ